MLTKIKKYISIINKSVKSKSLQEINYREFDFGFLKSMKLQSYPALLTMYIVYTRIIQLR